MKRARGESALRIVFMDASKKQNRRAQPAPSFAACVLRAPTVEVTVMDPPILSMMLFVMTRPTTGGSRSRVERDENDEKIVKGEGRDKASAKRKPWNKEREVSCFGGPKRPRNTLNARRGAENPTGEAAEDTAPSPVPSCLAPALVDTWGWTKVRRRHRDEEGRKGERGGEQKIRR